LAETIRQKAAITGRELCDVGFRTLEHRRSARQQIVIAAFEIEAQ
jgi:hypothetical protein